MNDEFNRDPGGTFEEGGNAGGEPAPVMRDGETGVPGVGARRRRSKSGRVWVALVLIVALIGAVLALSVFLKDMMERHKASAAEARAAQLKAGTSSGSSNGHDFAIDGRQLERDRALQEAADAGRAQMPVPAGAQSGTSTAIPVGGAPSTQAAGGPMPANQPVAQPWFSGVTMNLSGKTGTSAPAAAVGDRVGGSLSAAGGRNALDEQLAPSATSRAAAVRASLDGDLTYMLRHGTLIPCVSPRIVTTYPGMGSCTLMDDVYSANGRTLLLRKGAAAHFEQRTALTQGQARIFGIFTEIDDGRVTVNLDSPATDPLGGSGIEAWVDNHFWERFGGAIMIGLIGDVGQMVSNTTAPSGSGSVQLSNTSSNGQSAMTELLRNTVNIVPTGYTNQGTVIYIYVARNADFGSVYELVRR